MNQKAIEIINACLNEQAPILYLEGRSVASKLTDADFAPSSELGRKLALCTHIKELNLDNNKLTAIPQLENLSSLQDLHLSENQISEIRGLDGLTSLRGLYLGGNQISEIRGLEGLSSLQELFLQGNQISEIRGLERLSSLRQLNLNSNQISEIRGLDGLSLLQQLGIGGNQISEIRGLDGLSSLQDLYLWGNQISEIRGLKGLSLLRHLDLESNQISEIRGLEGLSSLQMLQLSENQISEIRGLEGLSSLQQLYLGNNQISEIRGLEGLLTLKKIDISHNQVENIEPLVPFLTRAVNPLQLVLKKETYRVETGQLNVYGNPLQTPPLEVVERGNAAVLRYFEKIAQEGLDYIYEAKLILVGEGSAGKTSLQVRLQDAKAELPLQDKRTRGIQIADWPFKANKGRPHIAHIWDFGGQDVYYPVHRFFLTENAVFVLLASTRQTTHNFDYWIPTIFQFGGKSPIILGQTCHDGNKVGWADLGYYVASELFNIIKTGQLPYHELNLVNNNEGLDAIKTTITEQLLALPHYGKAVPASWVGIRDAVATMAKNKACIPFQQFVDMCRSTNPTSFANAVSIEDCARFLHSIGVVLWYADIEALKDWVVLQPKWAMNAVYEIIDDETIQNRRGIILAQDFNRLWQDTCYEQMHGVLKTMLQVFKIAFAQKHRPTDYIIPARLLFMPSEARWPIAEPGLRLHYKYDFMPRGMVNQLSAELSRHIIEESGVYQVWNDAVNFSIPKARCQVREEFNKDSIYIKAIGSDAHALVTLVMNSLKDITDSYKGVKQQIFVPCTCSTCSQLSEPTTFLYDKLLQWEEKRDNATVTCNESNEQLSINMLLRNVGLPNPVKEAKTRNMKKIFISYSKHDEEFKEEFHSHLVTLREQGLAYDFNCKQIDLGAEWDPAIQQEIDDCDMMICLVSKGFLNTPYIRNNEVKVALEKGKQVIPVIIKPCDWENSNIGQLYAPLRGKPVSLNHEKLLRNIIEETTPIERDAHWNNIIKELREKVFKA